MNVIINAANDCYYLDLNEKYYEDDILDEELINKIKVSLEKAKRPLILAGNGIKLAGASEVFRCR